MHHTNHWYGHAHVLARYCGLPEGRPPRIHGYLQHGWNVLDGYGTYQPFEPGWTRFVWSDACRRRGWTMGRRGYYVIGAPWNYLRALEPAASAPEERTGTIWYPFHGWENQHVTGDHQRLIDEIREVEREPVTVCLYWLEYDDERIRGLYESAGFRVISHGFRGLYYRRSNPAFLPGQLAELRRHRRVASNRLSTAILYGISAGCEPAVYGDPMELDNAHPIFGGMARLRRLWPELHGAEIDLPVAREIADTELGTNHLVTPAELRELFGWRQEAAA
ncbi:hypothetical protein ACGFNU_26060 [Spirillospora sp. NPDC048911]|uniref:hypothetical protein n=1 Tax=Spirillospora sp. NPDC048911 TaxID=3364527 RepID=UPI003718421E